MTDINQVHLQGTITKVKYKANGKKAEFNLTTKIQVKKQDGSAYPRKNTAQIVKWDSPFKIGEHDIIAIKGRLDWESWENKEGEKQFKNFILADQIKLIKKGEPAQQENQGWDQDSGGWDNPPPAEAPPSMDDIPY